MQDKINEALSQVIDPETGLSITRMDLIHDIDVTEDGEVSLIFRPSSPVCPMAYSLAHSIKTKLTNLESVNSVHIKVENFLNAAHLEGLLNK